jgi:CRP-like cAMP-binding protein
MGTARPPRGRTPSGAIDAIQTTWPTASAETHARLAGAASIIEQTHGTIMDEAERPSRVGLVLQGTFAATWGAPDGRLAYVGLYGPVQLVGLATLSGGPNVVGIDALTAVTMLAWPTAEFRDIVRSDPALALDLLDRAIYGLHGLTRLHKLRTFTTAASRLAGLLLGYERFFFSRDAPLVGRRHIAALAGVTPEMARRILHRWEDAEILRRVGQTGLELLDRRALEAEAAPLADFPPPDIAIPGAWSVAGSEA